MGKKQYEEMDQIIQNDFDLSRFDSSKWFNQKKDKEMRYGG